MATISYAQWVSIILQNFSPVEIKIKNVKLQYGKFHKDGNKDDEIQVSAIENVKIGSKQSYQINSCGREHSPSGTEGSFELVDTSNNNSLISKVSWNCPWSGSNSFSASQPNPQWVIGHTPVSSTGSIGTVTVKIVKLP